MAQLTLGVQAGLMGELRMRRWSQANYGYVWDLVGGVGLVGTFQGSGNVGILLDCDAQTCKLSSSLSAQLDAFANLTLFRHQMSLRLWHDQLYDRKLSDITFASPLSLFN
jgi:hypothetical protein